MVYRLYKSDDFAALYAIEEVCFKPPFRFGRRYMRHLTERRETVTWIAEQDGAMAGFAIVEWTQEIGGVIGYIQTLEVLPSMRNRGAGTELLRRVEASMQEKRAYAIWLHVDAQNAGAIRLYEAQGYAGEGRRENYYAHGRPALIYRKALTLKEEV